MNLLLKQCLRFASLPAPPLAALLGGREPAVLMYHGVPRKSWRPGDYAFCGDDFQRQVIQLKSRFSFIHPDELFRARSTWDRKAVLLTFDDGLRNNAAVAAPILARHGVPALFFVCSRHVGSPRVLWFAYLEALERRYPEDTLSLDGRTWDMSRAVRARTLAELREYLLRLEPHPAAMYAAIETRLPPLAHFLGAEEVLEYCSGMTEEQLADLASNDLFSVGAHTVDHPVLTRCSRDEAVRQLAENRQFLERVCNRPVTAVAYPAGEYNESIVEACRQLGFRRGYAVKPLLKKHPDFEVPRAGVWRRQEEVAVFKALWARRRVNRG
jgi:peptidoglycan/xylan/chitin deacetylase (PgdA/CDA1 family)